MASYTVDIPEPDKVVYYNIGSANPDPKASLFLYGKADAPNIAIVCAGYPDDHDCFMSFASNLAKQADCLVGVTCLPGFDDSYASHKIEGYTFDEWAEAMMNAVKCLRNESKYSSKKPAQLTGIFHDWGCVAGKFYFDNALNSKNEDEKNLIPDKLVYFDVCGSPHPDSDEYNKLSEKKAILEMPFEYTYRLFFAISFALRLYVSKWLAGLYTKISEAFLLFSCLGPCYSNLDGPFDGTHIKNRTNPISLDRRVYMKYPYYNLIKIAVRGMDYVTKRFHFHLPRDLTKTPVLFIYGKTKRCNFHDNRSVDILNNEEKLGNKSRVVALDNAGHWCYIHKPKPCLDEVVKFIKS